MNYKVSDPHTVRWEVLSSRCADHVLHILLVGSGVLQKNCAIAGTHRHCLCVDVVLEEVYSLS